MTDDERKQFHEIRESQEPLHNQGAQLEQPDGPLIGGSGNDMLQDLDSQTIEQATNLNQQVQAAQMVEAEGTHIPLVAEALHHDDVKALQTALIRNPNTPQKEATQQVVQDWYKQALPGIAQFDDTRKMVQPPTPKRPANMAALFGDTPSFVQASQDKKPDAKARLKDLEQRARLAKKAKNVPLPGGGTLAASEKKTTRGETAFPVGLLKEQTMNKEQSDVYRRLEKQRLQALDETPLLAMQAAQPATTDDIKAPQITPPKPAPQIDENDLGDGFADIADGEVLGGLSDVSQSFREFAPTYKGINSADALSGGFDAAQQFQGGDKLGGALSLANTGLNMYQDYSNFQNMQDLSANGGSAASGAMGASGAAGQRVICTELHAQGLMADDLYKLDVAFTKRCLSPVTVRGYHLWAIPLVRKMRKNRLLTRLIQPFATWRAKEIAYLMGARDRGHFGGMMVRLIGEPLCFLLGLFCAEKNWQELYS
ncbi:hypothetical protein RYZ26_09975 [Terasakiella sp. A23]|uniref:hypothetical protein n=1 Tax=Terasakiella sp. FCG-A23 TaxID=3080561 RepID=UPI002952DFD6|nr:hypothetical protein [Terasakiella sp. A23]MDV7339922.1 hypothetical protein [Terasakiella sp. A23]